MMPTSIYEYVIQQESAFETEEITVGTNWNWNFRRHVQPIFHLKNGIFYTGENDWLRAFKNIMEPILNLAYWSEDIELKDVVFFIESAKGRVLSFFVKKYHDEVYVRQHNLDTMLDEITESDVDYGGTLVQKTNTPKPEVIPLNTIAFCDQTDILGAPLGFKHFFSPSKLRKMGKAGWGDKANGATISVEDLCILASADKKPASMPDTQKNKTPGIQIEIYIIKGDLPDHYLNDNNDMEYYCNQVQVIGFYYDKNSKRQGVTLYRKEETDEESILFHTSKKVYGRALGRGVGESILHDQVWTNCLTIWKMNMLEAASKVPLVTDDPNYTNKNRITDMETLEITVIEDQKTIRQIPTAAPANIALFSNSINEWYEHVQLAGDAQDPLLGKESSSGTTFRGQERLVAQGSGPHKKRRGQRAKFVEEIYRKMIIPQMVKEINKGREFLATLTTDEIEWIAEQLAENYANGEQAEDSFNGVVARDKELLKQKFLEDFSKKGSKHLLEVIKGELKGVEIKIGINVAGKQKSLADLSDKVLSILQFAFSNPVNFQQTLQIPGMSKLFNNVLEFSGLNEADFSAFTRMAKASQNIAPQTSEPSPIQPAQQLTALNQPQPTAI